MVNGILIVLCLQKAQGEDIAIKIKYKDVPIECDPSNMNSLQFLTNIFSKFSLLITGKKFMISQLITQPKKLKIYLSCI